MYDTTTNTMFVATLVGYLEHISTCAQSRQVVVIADGTGDMPQTILNVFQAKNEVTVEYRIYEEQPAAIEQMQAGADYDLVFMGSFFVPQLIKDGLLVPIDYRQIPNFRYVSASFRDLSYDPGGKHSIVHQWGFDGLGYVPIYLGER